MKIKKRSITTRSENMIHAQVNGRVWQRNGFNLVDKVQSIRKEYGDLTLDQVARKYNVSQITIWRIIHNKTYRYV